MTSLNSKLQLALINRKKGRNLLEKGFTLVELMIVIVIVGVLSAVALPSFLGQQNKAKATEATSKLTALLKEAHADYQLDASQNGALTTANKAADAAKDTGKFDYTLLTEATNQIYGEAQAWGTNGKALPDDGNPGANAEVDAALAKATNIGTSDAEVIAGCINLDTGKIELSRGFVDQTKTTPDFAKGSCA